MQCIYLHPYWSTTSFYNILPTTMRTMSDNHSPIDGGVEYNLMVIISSPATKPGSTLLSSFACLLAWSSQRFRSFYLKKIGDDHRLVFILILILFVGVIYVVAATLQYINLWVFKVENNGSAYWNVRHKFYHIKRFTWII